MLASRNRVIEAYRTTLSIPSARRLPTGGLFFFQVGGLAVADTYGVPELPIWSAPWVMAGFAGIVHDCQNTARATHQNRHCESNQYEVLHRANLRDLPAPNPPRVGASQVQLNVR